MSVKVEVNNQIIVKFLYTEMLIVFVQAIWQ